MSAVSLGLHVRAVPDVAAEHQVAARRHDAGQLAQGDLDNIVGNVVQDVPAEDPGADAIGDRESRERGCRESSVRVVSPGQAKHLGRDVDTDGVQTSRAQPPSEPAGTAADVQHWSIARLDHAPSKVVDERGFQRESVEPGLHQVCVWARNAIVGLARVSDP